MVSDLGLRDEDTATRRDFVNQRKGPLSRSRFRVGLFVAGMPPRPGSSCSTRRGSVGYQALATVRERRAGVTGVDLPTQPVPVEDRVSEKPWCDAVSYSVDAFDARSLQIPRDKVVVQPGAGEPLGEWARPPCTDPER